MPTASSRSPRGSAASRWITRPLSLLSLALLLVAASAAAFVFAARHGALTPSEDELRARYGVTGSRFITVDGEPVHVVDEGQGEAVVLLHGSVSSLRQWNDWAVALRPRYRVIRYDRAPLGLSGATAPRGGDLIHATRELEGVLATLGVARFHLVATSSAGELGAAYAAEHPERVQSLILANIAPGPFSPDANHRPWLLSMLLKIEPAFGGWHSSLFWREVLRLNFFDPARVTASLAGEWADLNNRTQRMPIRVASSGGAAPFVRTPGDLSRIRAPTLVLWSENDAELPLETMGRKTLALLGSSDKQLRTVARCGHLMPLECGAESAAIAGEFLDRVSGLPR